MRALLDITGVPVDTSNEMELKTIAKALANMTGGRVWKGSLLIAEPREIVVKKRKVK